jgi:hypothetical protein
MLQVVWEHRILLFSIGCHGVLLWRLASEGLAGIYPFLTLFLAAEMAQNIAFVPLRPDSNAYASTYFYSTPVLWVLAYLVVLELYRLILEDYPGISSVGRKAVSWCMGLAVIVSAATAIPDLKRRGTFHRSRTPSIPCFNTGISLSLPPATSPEQDRLCGWIRALFRNWSRTGHSIDCVGYTHRGHFRSMGDFSRRAVASGGDGSPEPGGRSSRETGIGR